MLEDRKEPKAPTQKPGLQAAGSTEDDSAIELLGKRQPLKDSQQVTESDYSIQQNSLGNPKILSRDLSSIFQLLESPEKASLVKVQVAVKEKIPRKPRLKQNLLANIEDRTLADIIDDKISGKPTINEVSLADS